MRVGRWIIGIVIGLALLAIGAVLAVTVFVDPNRYRGQIEAAVTRATGQPFRIKGDLEIAWYPWLALRMGPAELGRVRASGEPGLVTWQAARVGAKLIPLTQGELIISRIRLDGPRIYLKRDAGGHANWDGLVASLKARPATAPNTGPNTTPGPQVAGFEIRDGTLDYIDEGKEPGKARHLRITNWQLDMGEWHEGATFPVETAFRYRSGDADAEVAPATRKRKGADQPPFELELRANARMHVSDDANDIDVFGLESTSTVRGGPLPGKGIPISAAMSRVALRLAPLDIGISEVTARVADARLTASIQAGETGPDKTAYIRGPASLEVPSVRAFLPRLGLKTPLPKDKGTIGALKLASVWEWNDGAVTVSGIDLQLDETHFSGELSRGKEESPVWTFALHGDKIGLSRYTSLEETSPEPFELPVAMLRALKMQGELTFDQAWLADAQMKNVRMKLELADGAVKNVQ